LAGLATAPAAFDPVGVAADGAVGEGFAGLAIAFFTFGAAGAAVVGATAVGAAGRGGGIAAVATGASAARAIVDIPGSIDSSMTIGKSPGNLAIREFPITG
jgi:hypothetical protein